MKRSGCDMTYDPGRDRWTVELLNGRQYGLHCGEGFGLSIGQYIIPCRLEMDSDWYIVLPGAKLSLRPRDTYKVEL